MGDSVDRAAENFTAAIEDGVRAAEKGIQAELGLSDDQGWVVTLIIGGGSCIFTACLCYVCNRWFRSRRQAQHEKELRAQQMRVDQELARATQENEIFRNGDRG